MKLWLLLIGVIMVGNQAGRGATLIVSLVTTEPVYVAPGAGPYAEGGNANFIPMTGWELPDPPVYTGFVAYSETQYRNPGSTFVYSGTAFDPGTYPTGYQTEIPSANFFGGAKGTGDYGLSGAASGSAGYRVTNTQRLFANTIRGADQELSDVAVSMLTVWMEEDFMELIPGGAALGTGASVLFNLVTGASGRTVETRLVIKQEENYYISSVVGSTTGTASKEIAVTDFSAEAVSWFGYDPLTDFDLVGDAVSLASLDNLSGIGLYGRGTTTSNNAAAIQIWNVQIAVVPEPGSLLLAGLGGLVILGLRAQWARLARRG